MVMKNRRAEYKKAQTKVLTQGKKAKRRSVGRRLYSRTKENFSGIPSSQPDLPSRNYGPPTKVELTRAIDELFETLYQSEANQDWLLLLHERMQLLHPDLLSTKRKSQGLIKNSQTLLENITDTDKKVASLTKTFEDNVRDLEILAVKLRVPPLGPVRLKMYQRMESKIEEREALANAAYENIKRLMAAAYSDLNSQALFGVASNSIKEREAFALKARQVLTDTLKVSAKDFQTAANPAEIEDLFIVIREVKAQRDLLRPRDEKEVQLAKDIDGLLTIWMERLESLVKKRGEIASQLQILMQKSEHESPLD